MTPHINNLGIGICDVLRIVHKTLNAYHEWLAYVVHLAYDTAFEIRHKRKIARLAGAGPLLPVTK